jgi:hypothetical protein
MEASSKRWPRVPQFMMDVRIRVKIAETVFLCRAGDRNCPEPGAVI